ncbi:unnamed protein product, partial [Scytosiphon promiscuus]
MCASWCFACTHGAFAGRREGGRDHAVAPAWKLIRGFSSTGWMRASFTRSACATHTMISHTPACRGVDRPWRALFFVRGDFCGCCDHPVAVVRLRASCFSPLF